MVKVGLEIHGYLNTNEKLFCRCKTTHGAKFASPNTNICPICTAQPGSKPLLPNKIAIEKAVQISLILGCKINSRLVWQRKHYDWPDLPKGYQNTISGSYATPIGEKGNFLSIGIREAHLEEDPAAWNPKTGEIDYNRSGLPLIEIVTEPDFSSSEQVFDWLKQLITTLSYIKALDKNSGLKADVNISLPELKGARVEVKNINSLTNIKLAIEAEIKRQKKEIPKFQETRMFNEMKGVTIKMREKEQADDYRFISEPDLPVIKVLQSEVSKIKENLPETPQEKLRKLIKKHNLEKKYAEILTKKLELAEFFEAVAEGINPKFALPWVSVELLGALNYNKKSLEETKIDAENFINLLKVVKEGNITELNAKDVIRNWVKGAEVKFTLSKSQTKISGKDEIENICKKIIKEHVVAVQDYKAGQQNALNFLIGKVMQATNKRADFKTAKDMLEKLLKH